MRPPAASGHNGRVSIELPPIGDLQHMLDRLKANDIAWFQEKYKSGHFAWLKDRWPASDYEKMGERIEAGDLWWVRDRLAGLDINGVQMFSGLARTADDDNTGLAAGAMAAGVAGTAAVAGAAKLSDDTDEKKKRKGAFLLIPLILIGGVLMGFVLTKCVKDERSDGGVVVDTTVAAPVETVPAEVATETTLAPAKLDLVDVAVGNADTAILVEAVNAAGFGPALKAEGPLTVFAPSNAAFQALPAGVLEALAKPENKELLGAVLSQHVVPGKLMAADLKSGDLKSVSDETVTIAVDGPSVSVNGAKVTQTDLDASNGVMHVIDKVLLPAGFDVGQLLGQAPTSDKNIVETAAAAGTFNRLGALVVAANLTDTLSGPGPFTVFAPTDEAFAKLPVGAVEALAKPENKDILTKVLTYHALSGAKMKADLLPGEVATIASDTVTISADGDALKVNDSNIVTADVAASNGVVHVIDTVLLPPGFDLGALGLAPDPATTNAAGDAVPESLTVYFASGKADLDGEAQAKIDGAVAQLGALSAGAKVDIIGHADKSGNPAKNQALSEQRANNVLSALKDGLGDKASNITFTTAAKGDGEPVENLDKSRRVTIEIQK